MGALTKAVYLHQWEDDGQQAEPWMRFRLVYRGELKSNQKDPINGQPDRLAEHKQSIRKEFHRQLKRLWSEDWFLSTHRVFPQDYGINRISADTGARLAADDIEMVSLVDAVAANHHRCGYRFVPLVRKDWKLLCGLDILFLRRDPPGSVFTAGDLDNRIKTLIDGLRMPDNLAELRGNETPQPDEDPFFCLLENDNLISRLAVESDRFLDAPAGDREADRRQVHVVITADVRPYDVTNFNQSFAS